ncbi:hypothetical protein [Pseudoalteromonas ruthenica]|uniref:hypothetical protein n=1 Tax=Pseudoalteromonas ruthenica TaxID=151081 RepID=UPI0012459126|nr:hypothetical protein [Pseudoalteromonas ruthenica]
MYDNEFIANLNKSFSLDHKKGAHTLGVSLKTYKSYRKNGNAPIPVKKLASIIARGYLPDEGPWKFFYIDSDNSLISPYGIISAGDIAFYHRKKWAAEKYREEYNKLKEKVDNTKELNEVQDKLLDLLVFVQSKVG